MKWGWQLTTLSRVLLFWVQCSRIKPDLILTHYAQGLWAWMSPLAGAPVVVSVMGGDILFDEQGSPSTLEKNATLEVLKQAGLLICKSPYLAQEAARLVPEAKSIVCGWGTDDTAFYPGNTSLLQRYNLTQDDTLVFSPRGLESLYNIESIIRAFAKADLPGDKKLLLSTHRADGEYQKQMHAVCEELAIEDSVVFLPPLGAVDMGLHYRAADVCISVPVSDGLPQTFFEASACGTPMIMSDLPNYNALIRHRETALLVGSDVRELADAMEELTNDAELAQSLVEQSQSLKKAYDADGLQTLTQELGSYASLKRPQRIWGGLKQFCRIFGLLVMGRPIASRSGQPVYDTYGEYFQTLFDWQSEQKKHFAS
ncbi:MAG: glycosyltransferase [Pseudodesulfovibrio sp.]